MLVLLGSPVSLIVNGLLLRHCFTLKFLRTFWLCVEKYKSSINYSNVISYTHEGPQIAATLEENIKLRRGNGNLPKLTTNQQTLLAWGSGWCRDSEKDIPLHLSHQHTGPGGQLFSASPLLTPSWASPQSVPVSQLGWQWPVPHLGGGGRGRRDNKVVFEKKQAHQITSPTKQCLK